MKIRISFMAAAAVILFLAGCTLEMPEPDSPAGKLFAEKCGICHPAPHPKMLNKTAWALQVERMEKKLETAKVREPLTAEEKATILGYLNKHSRKKGF